MSTVGPMADYPYLDMLVHTRLPERRELPPVPLSKARVILKEDFQHLIHAGGVILSNVSCGKHLALTCGSPITSITPITYITDILPNSGFFCQ